MGIKSQMIASKLTRSGTPSGLGQQTAALLRQAEGTGELRVLLRKVLSVIRDSLPAETIVASDMTQLAYAANEDFPVDLPGKWLHPAGFATLGVGE